MPSFALEALYAGDKFHKIHLYLHELLTLNPILFSAGFWASGWGRESGRSQVTGFWAGAAWRRETTGALVWLKSGPGFEKEGAGCHRCVAP